MSQSVTAQVTCDLFREASPLPFPRATNGRLKGLKLSPRDPSTFLPYYGPVMRRGAEGPLARVRVRVRARVR